MTSEPTTDVSGQAEVLWETLGRAKRVVVGSHISPDGDAIGSALAMSHALDQLGVAHDVKFKDPVPDNLLFLPGIDRITHTTDGGPWDLALVLDLEAFDRLGSVRPCFDQAPFVVIIDHHLPIEAPGDLRIVDVRYPATCSILTELFQNSKLTVTKEIAVCLATGILTDTGNFKFPNTTAQSLHQVAWLVERGADISHVSEQIYMQRPLAAARIGGYAQEKMTVTGEGKLAYCTLPYRKFEEYGATEDDTEGVVNELLSVQGVEVAFLLLEAKPGKVRGSVRARGDVDVAAIVRQFGGGGHKNAAGVSFQGDPFEAETLLREAILAGMAP